MALEFFATHCHVHEITADLTPVHDKWFADKAERSAESVLESARGAGVTRMLAIGTTLADSKLAVQFAGAHEGVWASIGIHPHEAKDYVQAEVQAEFAARGFTCVGAVVDERPVAQLTREAGELAASFPVGLADAPVVGAFGGPAAIRAIPTAFLISREGVILRSYAGYTPLTRFREDIASALDGQPLPDVPPAPGATLPEKSTVKKTAP